MNNPITPTHKTSNLLNTIGIIIIGILACVIVVCYAMIKDHNNNYQIFKQNLERFSQLQRLDADWSVALLQTKSNDLKDFDTLSKLYEQIRELILIQSKALQQDKYITQDIDNQYQRYRYLLKAKRDLIEYYKGDQAILRNSIRYAPFAARLIRRSLQSSDVIQASQIFVDTLVALDNFIIYPKRSSKDLSRNIANLKQNLAVFPQDTLLDIQRFISHVAVILKYKNTVDQHLQEALQTQTNVAVTNLIENYKALYQSKSETIHTLESVIQVSFVMLVATVLLVVTRFYLSTKKLSHRVAEVEEYAEQLVDNFDEQQANY